MSHKGSAGSSYNIGINVGAAAGQTVPHLHVHVIPRYNGDVPDPRGGVRHVIPGKGNYLAVERGDDTTESLSLDTRDLAEKFVSLYWRQVLQWVHGMSGAAGRLHQATGAAAAILNRVGAAHERYEGSLTRFRRDRREWARLLREVARVIGVMPLWKLQTVGRQKLDFLYPNTGKGDRIRLHTSRIAVILLKRQYTRRRTSIQTAAFICASLHIQHSMQISEFRFRQFGVYFPD